MSVILNSKHHRNPSGKNNKIKWLLSEAKWDEEKLELLITKVLNENDIVNWSIAYASALVKIDEVKNKDKTIVKELDAWLKRNTNKSSTHIRKCIYDIQKVIQGEI